jgi:L-iditol 2-dehydrogenase
VITALGPNQPAGSTLKVGDRVAMEVGVMCGECKWCKTGRYNLCPKMRFRSSAKTFPHLDGTMREFMTNDARLCYK